MEGEYVNEILPPLGAEPEPEAPAEPEEPQETGEEEETPTPGESDPEPEQPKEPEAEKKVPLKALEEERRKRQEQEREAEYWRNKANQKPEPEKQADVLPPGFPAKPTVDQFDTYEEFVEELADWRAELKLVRREIVQNQKQEAQKQQETYTGHLKRVEVAQKAYDDFSDVVAAASDIVMPPETLSAIVESDQSADLLYYLAKNREEAQRIAVLPVARQLKEIGRIEARLEKKSEPEAPPIKRVTKAPEPIKPVGNNEKAIVSPEDMTDEQWLDYERKRLAKMGRLY